MLFNTNTEEEHRTDQKQIHCTYIIYIYIYNMYFFVTLRIFCERCAKNRNFVCEASSGKMIDYIPESISLNKINSSFLVLILRIICVVVL